MWLSEQKPRPSCSYIYIHNGLFGQAEVICFPGGCISHTVIWWQRYWCLWGVPVVCYGSGIIPMPCTYVISSPWWCDQGHVWTTCDIPWGPLASSLHTPHPTLSSSHPPTPSLHWPKTEEHRLKNHLKRLKIQQGYSSKVNYTIVKRLLWACLLNKHSLAQAKASFFVIEYYKLIFLDILTGTN